MSISVPECVATLKVDDEVNNNVCALRDPFECEAVGSVVLVIPAPVGV